MKNHIPFPSEWGSVLFRYLAIAARHQTPFTEVFDALKDDKYTFGKHTKQFAQLAKQPHSSGTLSGLLATQTGMFPPATLALIAQAESAGKLTTVLDALSKEYHQSAQDTAKRGMAWPITLIIFLFLTMGMLSVFVAPTFKRVFDSFGGSLPLPTELLFDFSDFLLEFWWIVVVLLLLLGVLVLKKGIAAITAPIYARIPIFRYCFERQRDARLALWIAAVGQHKPLLIAALQHLHLEADTVATAVQTGKPLKEALSSIKRVSPSLLYAVHSTAAENGTNEALNLCQELTNIQAEKAGERLGRWIFFASYIGIGSLVAFMLVAMYLPIFKIGSVV